MGARLEVDVNINVGAIAQDGRDVAAAAGQGIQRGWNAAAGWVGLQIGW